LRGRRIDFRNIPALVFSDLKIAYIPIPKTACSSIKNALMPLVGKDPLQSIDVHNFDGFSYIPLADCSFSDEWFVFTTVREPIDRAISAWQDKVGNPDQVNVLKKNGIYPGDSFKYFVYIISLWPAKALDPHVMPQSDILYFAKGLPLQVYHFEELGAAWDEIRHEIESRGGPRLQPLRKINPSEPHDIEISGQTERRLKKLYREDFERFGYKL
jgi:hypothetical protein